MYNEYHGERCNILYSAFAIFFMEKLRVSIIFWCFSVFFPKCSAIVAVIGKAYDFGDFGNRILYVRKIIQRLFHTHIHKEGGKIFSRFLLKKVRKIIGRNKKDRSGIL